MRVIVCGGRNFEDFEYLRESLNSFHNRTPITHIISGGAPGADTWAVQYAEMALIDYTVYHAQWDKHGKGAGPIRNQQMIDEGMPNQVIAFPGGNGTADMIKRARKAGLPVTLFNYNEDNSLENFL